MLKANVIPLKKNAMFRILVVEDDARVAALLRQGLQESGYDVLVAFDGEMGLKLFRGQGADLVVSDVVLPGMGGFDMCKEIRKADSRVPVIMLTALGTTDDKLEGFDAGADDYMVKPFDFRELNARISALLKRRSAVVEEKPQVLSCADLEVNTATKTVTRGGMPVRLTPKEYNLLVFMLENKDRVVSRPDIADKVWHTHFDTGTNFIDVYINYLRKKIDRDFDLKLIHTRTGLGFILTDKP